MIRTFLYLLISMLLFGPGDGKKKGRKGNAYYENEQYAEAVEEFRLGISALQESGPGPVHAGLLNNLGASLYRSGNMEEASRAFSSAVQMASTESELARASYNAGNASASSKQLEAALGHYRQALLSDPSNQDAKFNYEFVKRKLEEEQQQQDQKQDQDQNKENEQENQDQQKSDQEQENQDQQQQDQEQQQQPSEDQEQKQQQEQPDPTKLSQEEAQRILEALENEEEQLLRQVQKMKTRPRRVEKDW